MKSNLNYHFTNSDLIKQEEWIRSHFKLIYVEFSQKELEEQIELKNNGKLKIEFYMIFSENFQLNLRNRFSTLSYRAVKFLMPFTTTYLCEKSFSSMIYIKYKYISRIRDLNSRLRLKLSKMEPEFDDLIKNILSFVFIYQKSLY